MAVAHWSVLGITETIQVSKKELLSIMHCSLYTISSFVWGRSAA